jgi:hypothetical protein
MRLNYSPKDWQLLSNYLDGQLTNREVSMIETRLQGEPQLKQTLLEMQQTRYLMQHAKQIPVPRSFTLTPEMAAQIRPAMKPLFPFFSFASVIATVFLVIVILFEFLPGMLSGSMSPKSAASNEMQALETAPIAAEAMDSADSPQIFEWGYPQAKIEGGYGGGGDMGAGLLTAPPVGGGIEIEPAMPEMPAEEPAPAAEEERSLTKQADSEPITGTGPILGIRPAEETDAFNESVLNILRESDKEPIPTLSEPFPWLRVSQILLGSIAIITAITAIILRKRSF